MTAPKKIAWITPTNGRKDLLLAARQSWYDNIVGKIEKEIIVDDSGNQEYHDWLKTEYPSAAVVRYSDKNLGYTTTMQNCFDQAILSGCDYVLHTEDDFVLKSKLDINLIAEILDNNEDLAQIVFKRSPVYQWEHLGTDLIDSIRKRGYPIEYREDKNTIAVNSFYWSANPNIYPIKVARLGWPAESQSEIAFSKKVFALGYKSAYLGTENDEPITDHIGHYRLGFGH